MIRAHPVLLAIAALVVLQAQEGAATILGSAQFYGVLGGSTVTNTGSSVIDGDLGVSPGTAITGFLPVDGGPGIVNGAVRTGPAANQAHLDLIAAYNGLWGMAPGGVGSPGVTDLTGQDLGSVGTLSPGVYWFDTSAQLTGQLKLDAGGSFDPFVFLIGSTLTTASDSSVANGSSNDLYFVVGSSATIGTGTEFQGNILADQSITLNTGANITWGRALALHAAVTMDNNHVALTPEPSLGLLLLVGIVPLGLIYRRRKQSAATGCHRDG